MEQIECPNHVYCGQSAPQIILNCHAGFCLWCNMSFGVKLDIKENQECPVCFETTTCVKQPQCVHHLCLGCFKRCHCGANYDKPSPSFPYDDETFDDYEAHPENYGNDPLIQQYRQECTDYEEAIYGPANVRNKACPLCRAQWVPVWATRLRSNT